MQANCYLVSCSTWEVGHECIIIDPGDEAEFISSEILAQKLKPVAIVLTHGHFDHVLGCLELQLNFAIPILINQRDEKLYHSANKSATHWQGLPGDPVPQTLQFIKQGDEIKFGEEKLTVIETPGHTPGSICLYTPPQPSPSQGRGKSFSPPAKGEIKRGYHPYILFTGDTLFADGIGSTNHSYSSPTTLQKSLQKIKRLHAGIIYPGHGQTTTLPFLIRGNGLIR